MIRDHFHHLRPRVMVVTLCMAATLAGCSILPKNEPVQIWQPQESNATVAVNTRNPDADFSLRVDTPDASGLLDNTAIVVMPAPGQVSVYKGASWSEPPAMLVRRRLVDAFMAAGLSSVTTDEDHFFADYSLNGNLRAFQSEYRSGSPIVLVRYDAQLRRGGSRSPFANHSFVVTATPAGTQVPQIVQAFGAADDKLAAQVVSWVVEQVHNAPAPDSSAPARRRH